MKKPLFLLLLAGLLAGCEKKEADVTDPTPRIELVSIGPSTVTQFQDSVLIVLSYEDGDGDLGGVHPDSSNLFVVDNRIGVPFEFRIQELVPGGADVPIKGKLNVVLQNLFITGSGSQESVTFDVYAVDRAGHRSNTLTTGAIQVIDN